MIYSIMDAGAAGLAAARHLKASSTAFEVSERERDVGGLAKAVGLLRGSRSILDR